MKRTESAVYQFLLDNKITKVNPNFYINNYLYKDIDFTNKRLLDIGGGSGIYAFAAVIKGASSAVVLEPEGEGGTDQMQINFNKTKAAFGFEEVAFIKETFQEHDSNAKFDIILLNNSINHLDEPNCELLPKDENARNVYLGLFKQIYDRLSPDGVLIASDCARKNLYGDLGIKSPFAPSIEWEKHCQPATWIELLEKVGFKLKHNVWNSPTKLGSLGKIFCANKLAGYFLNSHFVFHMYK